MVARQAPATLLVEGHLSERPSDAGDNLHGFPASCFDCLGQILLASDRGAGVRPIKHSARGSRLKLSVGCVNSFHRHCKNDPTLILGEFPKNQGRLAETERRCFSFERGCRPQRDKQPISCIPTCAPMLSLLSSIAACCTGR